MEITNKHLGLSEELGELLDSLGAIPGIKQNKSKSQRFTFLQEKFENQTFQLVVLGQFKRGKTSLINALIGKDLLPTAIVPLTSIITILKYGKKEKITTLFLDGSKKEIRHSELAEYITESKNPKNEKEVDPQEPNKKMYSKCLRTTKCQ